MAETTRCGGEGMTMVGMIARARPEVRALAGLAGVAAVACALIAMDPMSAGTPRGLLVVLAAAAALIAVGVLVADRHVSERALAGVVVVGVGLTSISVAASATTGGALLNALAYVWLTVYTAVFLPRWAMRAVGVLVPVGFGAGLLASGLPQMLEAWMLVSLTGAVFGHALAGIAEQARRHAETDHVTGLLNRRAFATAAEREHQLAARTGAPLALVLIDLDDFKAVNDREGHVAGDRLLADIARAWHGVLRPADVLARHGGDEFAVLLPATSEDGAAHVLSRLRAAHGMTWSAGVAAWAPQTSLDDALATADCRLYAEKGARRARGDRAALRSAGGAPASEPA